MLNDAGSRWRRRSAAAAFLAIVAYIWLATRHLTLPGLYYDEALQATGSAPPGHWGLELGGQTIRLMDGSYIGSVKSYLLDAVFSVSGMSVQSLRLTTIITAAVGLAFTARLGWTIFGPAAGVIVAWLTATDPTFVLLTRTDWGPVALAFALRVASLFYLWRWWVRHDTSSLAIGSALLGFGLYDKANFIWFIGAVLVAGAVGALLDRCRPTIWWPDFGIACLAFFGASAPFWIFNLTHQWITIQRISSYRGRPSSVGLLDAMPERTTALLQMLRGRSTALWMFGESLPSYWGFSGTLLLPLAIVAMLVLLWAGRSSWRYFLPLILTGVMLAEMFAMPRPIWVHHWFGIYPFPHLAIAAAVAYVIGRTSGVVQRRRQLVAAALVALALVANLVALSDYRQLMSRTGGAGVWTDAIYELHDTLSTDFAGRPILVLSWGVALQLRMLSGGKMRLGEPYDIFRPAAVPPVLVKLIQGPANVFIAPMWRTGTGTSALSLLDEASRKAGCVTERSRRLLKQRTGAPAYAIVEFDTSLCPRPQGTTPTTNTANFY